MGDRTEYMRRYREEHAEEIKEWRRQHHDEHAEYSRRYRKEHRDELIEKQKQYYAEHRDELSEKQKQYYAKHRDELSEKQKRYYAEHRDELNEKQHQRYVANQEKNKEYARQRHYNKGAQPMSDNRSCSSFLGIYVAENLLSNLFKNVTRMPNNNHGFDFICGQGYMVDAKSRCSALTRAGTVYWAFKINRNTTADFFLCIAFDNRRDLNPLHYWLIPGKVLSHLTTASISETTLDRWAEYEKPIDEAIICCNTIKEAI